MNRSQLLIAALLAVVAAQAVFPDDDGTSEASTDSGISAFQQYELQKKEPWIPVALNAFLGFGIGSFVEGQTTTGLLLAGGDVLGIGLVIVGAVGAAGSTTLSDVEANGILALAGYVVVSASRIAGIVAPILNANSFNEKLRNDLGISVSDVSLIVPGINGEVDRGYGVSVTLMMES